jgi:rhamnopyranosyl-N-acetylglucosaminyl-diphospho-decaprenol beta-1,3/1,4-galactofuranosyltransferase
MELKVGVVVLTYNRLDLLKITICKILAQDYPIAEILIIDNFSTDGTKQYLESLTNCNKIYLDDNLGPAGGFYEGVKYFAEKSVVDYVWLMDDDFFPSKTCLGELVKHSDHNSIVFPYVREKDFAFRNQPGWWGVLIPLEVIERVGYPRKDLFFWAEDTDYLQHRIRDVHKIPNKWISSAKGVHFTKRVKNHRPPWRYYYEIRNTIILRLYIRKSTPQRLFKLTKSWILLFGSIILNETNKREKIKWFMIGTYHGILKKTGKTIDPLTGKR